MLLGPAAKVKLLRHQRPLAYWSSCAAYALGTPNPLLASHPSYLALSPPAVRRRHYRAWLAPREDPQVDTRDPRWTIERAVGGPAFLARFAPRRGGGRRTGTRSKPNQALSLQ